MTKGPVLIELDADAPARSVADAPPVPEATSVAGQGEAMRAATRLATKRPSRLARWFWGLATALFGAVLSVAAWAFVTQDYTD